MPTALLCPYYCSVTIVPCATFQQTVRVEKIAIGQRCLCHPGLHLRFLLGVWPSILQSFGCDDVIALEIYGNSCRIRGDDESQLAVKAVGEVLQAPLNPIPPSLKGKTACFQPRSEKYTSSNCIIVSYMYLNKQ